MATSGRLVRELVFFFVVMCVATLFALAYKHGADVEGDRD